VKRAIIITLGLAAALGGGGWLLLAQQSAAPPPATKVGVVDMRKLYGDCKYVKDLKTKIEDQVKPFKTKKEELDKLMVDWQTALKSPKITKETREQGYDVLKECKRRLEDLDFKFKQEVSPKLQKDMENLVANMNQKVKIYSEHFGYHLVVAYGQPELPLEDGDTMRLYIQAIDFGYIRVACPSAVDITSGLLTYVNQ